MKRFFLVLCIATSAAALVVAPASGGERSCRTFEPSVAPEGATGEDSKAFSEAPVHVVSDEYTKAHPLIAEYEHGVGATIPFTSVGVVDNRFVKFQVRSHRVTPGLHIKAEWPVLSPTDIDLYLFDQWGTQVADSEAWNVPVFDDVWNQVFYENNGGLGYEYLEGVRVHDCDGYSLESSTSRSPGTRVTLKVWIGPQESLYD